MKKKIKKTLIFPDCILHKIEFTRNAQSKNNLIVGGSGCGKARCFDVTAHNSLTEIGKNFENKNRKSNTQEKE